MTKDEIKAKLDEAGISYKADATKAELEALLPVAAPVEPTPTPEETIVDNVAPEVKDEVEEDGITVADPEELRPKELPLVVKPGPQGWANKEQEAYAQTLNGYAYKNPTKFKAKKAELIKQLKELAVNPGLLAVLQGHGDEIANSLNYKNHITQGNTLE